MQLSKQWAQVTHSKLSPFPYQGSCCFYFGCCSPCIQWVIKEINKINIESRNLLLREHSFFRSGGGPGRIPMSMKVKSLGPPFIFGVKKCDCPTGSSKIYSDPPLCCVKFMLTLPLWAGKKLMTLPWILLTHPLLKNECSLNQFYVLFLFLNFLVELILFKHFA